MVDFDHVDWKGDQEPAVLTGAAEDLLPLVWDHAFPNASECASLQSNWAVLCFPPCPKISSFSLIMVGQCRPVGQMGGL